MKIQDYDFPDDLLYVTGEPGHFWIEQMSDNKVKIGIDHYASSRAGTIEYVMTMKIDKRVKVNETIGTIESGKWVGQLKSPISGIIVEKNENLRKNPELINKDPYGEGWVLILEGKDLETQFEENTLVVPAGEKLEEYILWRISQE
ncbi:MAG: glycine cleavage system protein H [Candidatus Heimdallarchaeaceae archaeon]